MDDSDKLRKRVLETQEAARLAEREFLLVRGWEEQGTYDDVTWWSYKGETSSDPQHTAVSYAIRGIEDRLTTPLFDCPKCGKLCMRNRPHNCEGQPQARRCYNDACGQELSPSHVAVYCSNSCAMDDA